MEVLKKGFIAIISTILTVTAFAQNDAALQSVFSESYTLEYNKKYNDAIALLKRNYNEKSYELNLRLGWLCYSNKNYTQSQQYYQQAVNLKSYAIEAKLGLLKPLAALELWDKVLDEYEAILKIDPQNYTANYWEGVLLYNRKKYEAASRLFEKLVNLYPFDYDANHMLGWSYLNLGRKSDAALMFNKALLNRPSDASCLDGLGRLK